MNDSASRQTWLNPKGPAAPVAWFGGKYYFATWIIEQFPDHRVYVEPFGGMASVLLKKQPSKVEVLNDLDGRVTNFFRVIRDPDQLAELKRRCELTPYSRSEFRQACETPEPEDAIDKAYWFFVRCRQARGGIGMANLKPKSWAVSTRSRRQMPEPVSKYLSALDGLTEVAHRLREVMIEYRPATELIPRLDGRDVLFYCDPPYLGATRQGGKANSYQVEMTELDHANLLQVLLRCEGHVILSGYPSELYDRALAGWQRLERLTHVQLSNSGGERTEVLWINRPVKDRPKSTFSAGDISAPLVVR